MEQNRGNLVEPPDKSTFYCKLYNIHCSHANPCMNKEIGYEHCSGEYCGDIELGVCDTCIHKDEMGTLQPCMQCIFNSEVRSNYCKEE